MPLPLSSAIDPQHATRTAGAARVPSDAAGAIADFAGWQVDLPSRATWWSEQALAIFDLPPGPGPSVEDTMAFCAAQMRTELSACFDACARVGQPYDREIDVTTVTGGRKRVIASARAVRGPNGAIMRIQGAFQEIGRPNRSEDDSQRLATRLANTLASMSEAFLTLDTAMRFTYLNPAAARLLNRERGHLLGKFIWDEFPEAIGGTSYHEYGRALREQCNTSFEEFYPPLERWFEVRSYPTEDGLAVYFHDSTERKGARSELRQAHRALQMLSRCNHVVVHAQRERDLIDEICRIAVEVGGYRMAWVGYAEQDERRSISIAAHAGTVQDIISLGLLPLSWSDDTEAGRGPVGLAIRSGNPVRKSVV